MVYLFLSALSLALCTLYSCGNDDDSVQMPTATDFMPLEIGTTWVYEVFFSNSGEQYIDTVTVVDTYADGDDIIYELSNINTVTYPFVPQRMRLSDGELYWATESENWIFLTARVAVTTEEVGIREVQPNLGRVIYRYYPALETVNVPAGSFDCINMEGEVVAFDTTEPANGLLIDNFFARGVGLVSAKTYFWSNGTPVELKLVDFQLP
ncbi:MAG: hypothetical protein AAFO02_23575 [Bacteroidota bacterium]